MANTKSATKEIRVANARQERNKSLRSLTKTIVHKAESSVSKGEIESILRGGKTGQGAQQVPVVAKKEVFVVYGHDSMARTQLDAQVTEARKTLEHDADQLGREIADKVLGRTN